MRKLALALAVAAALPLLTSQAWAISSDRGSYDPNSDSTKVTCVSGCSGGGGTSGGTATAAAPTLTEGQTNVPASVDLGGNLRVKDSALLSAVQSPVPAGTFTIGNTNGFQNSSGPVLAPAADSSAAINVSTATTTQIVALSSGKKIYVGSLDVIAGGTGNITFVYGTGSNCGTGTTSLTGAYNLTAQAGLAKGNGLGAVLVVPASNALCVTTSAAVQMSGSVSFTQF